MQEKLKIAQGYRKVSVSSHLLAVPCGFYIAAVAGAVMRGRPFFVFADIWFCPRPFGFRAEDCFCRFLVGLRGVLSGLIRGADERRNKTPYKSAVSAAFDIEKAEKGKDQRADEVDEQIADRVDDADVDISSETESVLRSVRFHDDDVFDLIDGDG